MQGASILSLFPNNIFKIFTTTGMRCCDVLGLRSEYVYDDHSYMRGQNDDIR